MSGGGIPRSGIPRTVALDRAIDVLSAVAGAAAPASASALARATGQPRATVSRTLRTLADRGLVAETPSGWVLGNELFRLARSADSQSALHASAAGKLLLAELSPSELEAWFEEAEPVRLTARTVTTVSGLAAELRRVRRRGWAEIVDELEDGLMSLSAPIRDRAGKLVAAIGLSGPSSRIGAARRTELVPFVLEAAAEVERALDPAATS